MPSRKRTPNFMKELWKRTKARPESIWGKNELVGLEVRRVEDWFRNQHPNGKVLYAGSTGPKKYKGTGTEKKRELRRIVSIDIAKAKKRQHVHFRGDIEQLPFRENSFNGLISVFTIDHTNKTKTAQEFRRVLGPGENALVVSHHPKSAIVLELKAKLKRIKQLKVMLANLQNGKVAIKQKRAISNEINELFPRRLTANLNLDVKNPDFLVNCALSISRFEKYLRKQPGWRVSEITNNMFKSKKQVEAFYRRHGFEVEVELVYERKPNRMPFSGLKESDKFRVPYAWVVRLKKRPIKRKQ